MRRAPIAGITRIASLPARRPGQARRLSSFSGTTQFPAAGLSSYHHGTDPDHDARFCEARKEARGARARLDHPRRRARRCRARARRCRRGAAAPAGLRVRRARPRRPGPPRPPLLARAAIRRGRGSESVRQLLAVRPRRARPRGRAEERRDRRRGVVLRDLPVLLRPPGEGARHARRRAPARPAGGVTRRGHAAAGALAGGHGARRRRRVGVGVRPDREVRARALDAHAADREFEVDTTAIAVDLHERFARAARAIREEAAGPTAVPRAGAARRRAHPGRRTSAHRRLT